MARCAKPIHLPVSTSARGMHGGMRVKIAGAMLNLESGILNISLFFRLTALSLQPHAESPRAFLKGALSTFENVTDRLSDLCVLQTARSV